MDVRVVEHPLAAARLTTLRDERTDNAAFRAALRDLTMMLVYEATRDAACEPVPVRTPLADTIGSRLANPPLLVPVLRAGLGMVDRPDFTPCRGQTTPAKYNRCFYRSQSRYWRRCLDAAPAARP